VNPEEWHGREVYTPEEKRIIVPKKHIYDTLESLISEILRFHPKTRTPSDESCYVAYFAKSRRTIYSNKNTFINFSGSPSYHVKNKKSRAWFNGNINKSLYIFLEMPILLNDNFLANPDLWGDEDYRLTIKATGKIFSREETIKCYQQDVNQRGPVHQYSGKIIEFDLLYSKDDALVQLNSRKRMMIDPDVLWNAVQRYALPARSVRLAEKLLEADITEEALYANQELWASLISVERNEFASKNKSFFVKDKDDQEWLIKLMKSKEQSFIEAAANYYLSGRFNFIMPSKAPEPFESHDVYMTMQKSARNLVQTPKSITYWLSSLALFHNEAATILRSNNIIPRPVGFRTAHQEKERFFSVSKRLILPFDKSRLEDSIAYLQQTNDGSLLHNDLKIEHMTGPYLLDLELIGTGNPGIDLAMLLISYQIPYEQWDAYLTEYIQFRGLNSRSLDNELKLLREGVRHGAYAKITSELICSELRFGSQKNKMAESILCSYLTKLNA